MASRLKKGYTESIEYAMACIPERMKGLVGVDFFTGTDPFWAGLEAGPEIGESGRLYKETAHTLYPFHSTDHSITIVLPVPETPWTILHEWGHALHYVVGLDWELQSKVTEYAKVNWMECFAEGFCQWFGGYSDVPLHLADVDFFDRLAWGE